MTRTDAPLARLAALGITAALAACSGGGGGSPTPPAPVGPSAQSVTATFANAYAAATVPQAVAYEINGGAWTSATLSGNAFTFALPAGTTSYGIAYRCATTPGPFGMQTAQRAIVLAPSDTVSPTISNVCVQAANESSLKFNVTPPQPPLAGANSTTVTTESNGGSINSVGGTIAFLAAGPLQSDVLEGVGVTPNNSSTGASGLMLAHIARGVTLLPGGTNALPAMTSADAVAAGGNVTFTGGDFTANQDTEALTYATDSYHLQLDFYYGTPSVTLPIPTFSPANTQAGDSYEACMDIHPGGNDQMVAQTGITAAGATVTLPAAWTPAAQPAGGQAVYTPYSGFTIGGTQFYSTKFFDFQAGLYTTLVESASVAGSAPTFTVPNLATASGFLAPASGDTISVSINRSIYASLVDAFDEAANVNACNLRASFQAVT